MNNDRSLTFVYGGDDFLVDRRARALFQELSHGSGEIVEEDCPLSEILSSIMTPSLFEESNVLWIREPSFFKKELADNERTLFQTFLHAASTSPDKTIIISSSSIDKRTRLFKDILAVAQPIEVAASNNADAIAEKTVLELCRENHVTISSDALQLLLCKCGPNLRLLEQEIQKLATYIIKRSSEITEDDVRLLVEDSGSGNFFDIVETFFTKPLPDVIAMFDRYFFSNQDPRPLLAALQSRNRLMIQLKTLLNAKKIRTSYNGISKTDLEHAAQTYYMNDLPKTSYNIFSQNPWYLGKLSMSLAMHPLSQLIQWQREFSQLFLTLLDTRQEPAAIFRSLATRCLSEK